MVEEHGSCSRQCLRHQDRRTFKSRQYHHVIKAGLHILGAFYLSRILDLFILMCYILIKMLRFLKEKLFTIGNRGKISLKTCWVVLLGLAFFVLLVYTSGPIFVLFFIGFTVCCIVLLDRI